MKLLIDEYILNKFCIDARVYLFIFDENASILDYGGIMDTIEKSVGYCNYKEYYKWVLVTLNRTKRTQVNRIIKRTK